MRLRGAIRARCRPLNTIGGFAPRTFRRSRCKLRRCLPGVEARPIRQVAEGEGRILGRIGALLWVVTIAALICALLAVAATAASTVLERQKEIGLMKALGATTSMVSALFLGEQFLLALAGGGLGYAIGVLLARWLSLSVFGTAVGARLILLPVTLLSGGCGCVSRKHCAAAASFAV